MTSFIVIGHNYYIELTFSTFPKTTCLPSSHDVFLTVMKNCDPLVSFPALAIDNHPEILRGVMF